MSEWIPIFKTGTHKSMSGKMYTYTEADLDTIVAKYNPSEQMAPEVIGHPETNSPAWGWVEALKREGKILYMKIKDRVPEFAEMLKKGMFKYRSIAINPDMTLRHVGWLGANPPAVKGLGEVKFAGPEDGVMEFTLNCDGCRRDARQNGRDARPCVCTATNTEKFSEKEGIMPGEKEVQEKIELEVEKRLKAEREKMAAEYAEAEAQKAKATEFAEAQAKREREIADREAKIAEKEKALKREEIKAFCEGLTKEGKLTPAMVKHGLVSFMETLSDLPAEPMQFAEGGATKQTPLEFMKSFIAGFGKQIEFAEAATREKDVKAGDTEKKRKAAIQSYMEANKGVKYRDAVLAVSKDNPELFER